MKVSELSGALLDYWVARAEGKNHAEDRNWGNAFACGGPNHDRCVISHRNWDSSRFFEPSKNWAHGGPIIDREQGAIACEHQGDDLPVVYIARLGTGLNRYQESGPTHLIAAMRAYVGSKFGAEVSDEVPL